MIKKLLLLPIILLVNILANAQIFTFENPMDTSVSTVFSGSYYYNSNVLTTYEFQKLVASGDELDNQFKTNLLSNLNADNNVAGLAYTSGIKQYIKSKNGLIAISIANNRFNTSNLTEKALQLAFNGNKQFENQTINLGNNNVYAFQYQKLGIGYQFKAKNWFNEFSVNILNASQLQIYEMKNTSLFTAKDGEYLDANIDLKIRQLNPYTRNMGFSFSWQSTKQFKNSTLNFGFADLGFISYNSVRQYNINNNYHFTGLAINDIFNLSSSSLGGSDFQNIDSVFDVKQTLKSEIIKTPTPIWVDYKHNFNKLSIKAGTQYVLFMPYKSLSYVFVGYKLKSWFEPQLGIAFGGLAGFDTYFNLNTDLRAINKHLKLQLQMSAIEGIIAPKQYAGVGITGNLVWTY
ncbi:MAG: hypothetical protein RLZZ175_1359 [Bacteroidota bacterium]|jgi:hypothetical protein